MPSSKWNRHPIPRLRPPICIAPYGSCRPPFDVDQPPDLQASVTIYDLDPLDPIWGSGYCQMSKTGPGQTFEGISPPAETRIGCKIFPAGGPNMWTVEATLYFPGHIPAKWDIFDVFVDPQKPFDTGLLSKTWIPAADYYRVRIST